MEVAPKLEDFFLKHGAPIRVITGKSHMMRLILIELMANYDLEGYHPNFNNTGEVVVIERNRNGNKSTKANGRPLGTKSLRNDNFRTKVRNRPR